MNLHEGEIAWIRDLNGSTGTTVFPSASTAGVAKEDLTAGGRQGAARRVHVAVDYTVSSGTMSCLIGVYGFANKGALTSTWCYLGAFNGGSPVTASTLNSASSTRIVLAEVFEMSTDNYSRLATRSIVPGGNSPVVSTYIGIPVT